MRREAALVWPLVLCALLLAAINANAASNGKTLKLKLNYTGTEKVDQNHKIYILLFDANPYTATKLVDWSSAGSVPTPEAGVCHILRREAASSKTQLLTFSKLGTPSVYAMAFVDKAGNYSPNEDPPSGSPMGMYGKSADKPEPISLDERKAVKAVLVFDDAHKTP